jgi:hypothetical protein
LCSSTTTAMQQSLLLSFAITDSSGWQPEMVFQLPLETQAEFAQRTNNAADSQDRLACSVIIDFADVTRPNKLGDFIRRQRSSKSGRGPFQRRSSTVSKTGTSSRRVAREALRETRPSLLVIGGSSSWMRVFSQGALRRTSRRFGGSDQPRLIVNDLKLCGNHGQVALWTGSNTEAYSSSLMVR